MSFADPAAGWRVPAWADGLRLDRILADHPALTGTASIGLRGRRRLCARGRVLVDGVPAGSARKLRVGQSVVVLETGPDSPPPAEFPRLIRRTDDLAVLYKPSGWHSARLAGEAGANSVEGFLAAVPPPFTAPVCPADPAFAPCLLNRLDQPTSGLIVLARTALGRARWLQAERAGQADKAYLALAEGVPSGPFSIRKALDTADRVRVRGLGGDHPDPLRHTLVEPLGTLEPAQAALLFPGVTDMPVLSLLLCRIRLGARHQIRAHLAGAGHPLFGDSLYGGRPAPCLLLHHGRLDLPGFSVRCPPPWIERLPVALRSLAHRAGV